MVELAMKDFIGRVLTSRERVKFQQADPYGHLHSGEFVSLVMGHRVEALQDQLGCDVGDWVRALNIGFVLREITMTFAAPAFVGDLLEIGSWGYQLEADGFWARFVILGEADRTARAFGTMRFVTVDSRSGRKVPVPETLPSRAEQNLLVTRPTSTAYLESLKFVPAGWQA